MSDLVFRPAQLSDEAAVVALSSQIWDGEDYVADCFHDWVMDKQGAFTVVYEGNTLVAFGKLSELGPGQWWLEGLRVDPKQRGRGLARRLHEYAVKLADEIGWGILRFLTASYNTPVHKLAQETGFRCISRHWLATRAIEQPPAILACAFRQVEAVELPQLHAILSRSRRFSAAHGLMEDEWVLYPILDSLNELQRERRLYWWNGPGEAEPAFIITSVVEEEHTFWLNYLDAPDEVLPALLADLPALAIEAGAQTIHSKPLGTDSMLTVFTDAGWTVNPDMQLWAYERLLARQEP